MLIEDIKQAITDMSTDELYKVLSDIRHNRSKEDIIIVGKKKKDTALEKLISSLSANDLAALLKDL